jgi:mRNA interferase RelE/StbE
MYDLHFLKPAQRYFKKIRDKGLQGAFRSALIKISVDPLIGEQKKGDLAGIYCYDVFCNKTNGEIAYRIYEKDKHLVVVIMAGTRKNFYEELKRYMR